MTLAVGDLVLGLKRLNELHIIGRADSDFAICVGGGSIAM